MQSSQVLVTDRDFSNADFRIQLSDTVNTLLSLRVIPVFNENDAISTRKAPYEVYSAELPDDFYFSSRRNQLLLALN
jgi:delta-1-pyrroline-5-carboxylate synthetase